MYVTLKSTAFIVASAFAPTLCPGGVSLPNEGADGSSTAEASSSSLTDYRPTSSSSGEMSADGSATSDLETSVSPTSSSGTSGSAASSESSEPQGGTTSTGEDVTTSPPKEPVCGDGHPDSGEECDDCDKIYPIEAPCKADSLCIYTNCDDMECEGCTLPFCGDGVVTIPEECDDGNEIAGDFCRDCKRTFHAFITSEKYSGDLGGIDGADAKCQKLGEGMAGGSDIEFKAWIATKDSDSAPSKRFLIKKESAISMIDADGQPVELVSSWKTLVEPNNGEILKTKLLIDEKGDEHPGGVAWTNVDSSGQPVDGRDCSGWTEDHFDFLLQGRQGRGYELDVRWTRGQIKLCASEARLYCFSQ